MLLGEANVDPQQYINNIYNDPALGFTIGVPDEWIPSIQNDLNADGSRVTYISSPSEGALDQLTDGDVFSIVEMRRSGVTVTATAARFGVDKSTVSRLCSGNSRRSPPTCPDDSASLDRAQAAQ